MTWINYQLTLYVSITFNSIQVFYTFILYLQKTFNYIFLYSLCVIFNYTDHVFLFYSFTGCIKVIFKKNSFISDKMYESKILILIINSKNHLLFKIKFLYHTSRILLFKNFNNRINCFKYFYAEFYNDNQ